MILDALDTIAAYWCARVDALKAMRDYANERQLEETTSEVNAQLLIAVQDYNLLLSLINDARKKGEN